MSTPDDDPLLKIAGAVADRTPVDWDHEHGVHAGVRPQIEQLRILEILMNAHPATPTDLLIGRTLSHFRIVSRIGAGGMGVVYRADDLRLRRPVALKLLPPDLAGDEGRRQRFLREARAAAAIPHPNIAGVHEVDEADGVVFIAMELIEGATLRRTLSEAGPFAVADALRIAVGVADGLGRAHRAGVLHRDLKPDNVIVTPEGHARILDFGLAKLLAGDAPDPETGLDGRDTLSGPLTQAGRIVGTAAYMSPEQARGGPVDARADLFSFGAMLYEMLTGRRPFRGDTSAEILDAVIHHRPPSASTINPRVPPRLDAIVARCLDKEPGARYQRAEDLAGDLRGVLSEAIGPAPPDRGARSLTWRRGLLAGLAALLVASGVWFWSASRGVQPFVESDRIVVVDFTAGGVPPGLSALARDAAEEMLARSSLLDVVRGSRLAELLGARPGAARTQMTGEIAARVCGGGGCAGFLAGRLDRDGGGFRIALDLRRPGVSGAVVSSQAHAASEEDVLGALHAAVLELRAGAGESPKAMAAVHAPTTRSLSAFQAYALARGQEIWNDRTLALMEQALTIDEGFLEAHSEAAAALGNLGNWAESRRHSRRAYELAARLPEPNRLAYEIAYLDSLFDYDSELRRMVSYRTLHPFDHGMANSAGWLNLLFENPEAAEVHLRAAYDLRRTYNDLEILSTCLADQEKADALQEVTADFLRRSGRKEPALWESLNLEMARRRWGSLAPIADRPDWQGAAAGWAEMARFETRIWAGRLREAPERFPAAWQHASTVGYGKFRTSLALQNSWIEARRTGRPIALPEEVIRRVGNSLLQLPQLATYSVETLDGDPLARAIRVHEEIERDSEIAFVRETIDFARGSLALVRGDARAARALLEPVVQARSLKARHHVLAMNYEALGMWSEAALQYHQVVKNVRQNSLVIPAIWFLDHFRLGRVYERAGDRDRARIWYERFLAEWKDADRDIPEIGEAKRRLALLAGPGA